MVEYVEWVSEQDEEMQEERELGVGVAQWEAQALVDVG
jgi:hypothetical protein